MATITPDSKVLLGLNTLGFNTSASLIVDGEVLFAVEEERLSREKRTRKFPELGVSWVLDQAQIPFERVDAVAVSWNPGVNLELHSKAFSGSTRYLPEVLYSTPSHLLKRLNGKPVLKVTQYFELDTGKQIRIDYLNHHLCHAASYYLSPFDEAAILTVDAFGEKECVSFSKAEGSQITRLHTQEFPHSLGSFYSTFTEFCGFTPQSHEWKLMGAAAYGDSQKYYDKIRALIDFQNNGNFELDLKYFNHYQFHRPHYYTAALEDYLGLEALRKGSDLTADYYHICAAAQTVFEGVYLHLLDALFAQTQSKHVVISGGSALNSLANGRIVRDTKFEDAYIPPAPDDAGAGMGAALYLAFNDFNCVRKPSKYFNYVGPRYSDTEIQLALDKFGLSYERYEDFPKQVATLLAEKKLVAWFQGALEFGDRALGNRSILADPRDAEMKEKLNASIKYRESFRPFAPAILEEFADEYFSDWSYTPYMERVATIKEEKRLEIAAVTHADGTGRLQTVNREQNAPYYDMIRAFYEVTGVPVVVNTSFNVQGQPMVCSPEDAITTFHTSGLDALSIGPFILKKG